MAEFTFTAKTEPECKSFLKIQWPGEEYKTIDEYIEVHPDITDDSINQCKIWYRGNEKLFKEYINEYVIFSEELELMRYYSFHLYRNHNIRAASFFVEKAGECLNDARFFAMKSYSLLDTDYNMSWRYGYVAQFKFRCLYFGTATTWYSNAFDQLLQAVYWGLELYTNVKDRDDNGYDESWDVKKIMTCCTYEYVVGELKERGLVDIRTALTSCMGKIQDVRSWANYIKHKGGIEYKFLEAENPFEIYVIPAGENCTSDSLPDDRFAIKNFKSPIEIDIDEKFSVIKDTHHAIYECVSQLITAIDFDKYLFNFGG